MQFSIFFFACDEDQNSASRYSLLTNTARLADTLGFTALWTPERHFDKFGAAYPNPALMSAALAMITQRLELRAGSVISPLHDVIRLVEEWAVADHLSHGRVALSFGCGWNVNDFVLFPDRYQNRQKVMIEQIATFKHLWNGGSIRRVNGAGKEVELRVYPQPFRKEIPIWITSSGNPATFKEAGRMGANILTHLIGQDLEQLAKKVAMYKQSQSEAGKLDQGGKVALMLHSYLSSSLQEARQKAYSPLREYLRSAVTLENRSSQNGGVISGGHKSTQDELDKDMEEELLELTVNRYLETASLIGTTATVKPFLEKLEEIGITEIACLVDFGPTEKEITNTLQLLATLI